VIGARVSEELLASIRATSPYPVVDATCSGNRSLEPLPPEVSTMSFDALMEWYAAALLQFHTVHAHEEYRTAALTLGK